MDRGRTLPPSRHFAPPPLSSHHSSLFRSFPFSRAQNFLIFYPSQFPLLPPPAPSLPSSYPLVSPSRPLPPSSHSSYPVRPSDSTFAVHCVFRGGGGRCIPFGRKFLPHGQKVIYGHFRAASHLSGWNGGRDYS